MHIIYAYADFINITSTPYGREATRRSAGDGRVGCGRRNHANLVRRQRLLASLTLEELESVLSLLERILPHAFEWVWKGYGSRKIK